MFVCSVKVSRLKTAALVLLSASFIATAFFLYNGNREEEYTVSARGNEIRFDGIETEEQLIAFVSSLGIEVKTPAYRSIDVDIPRVFDAVYSKYNDIQKQQGFNLEKYKGKTLHRYTFEMTNYPTPDGQNGKVFLTLFVYKNKIVGGDISSRDFGGFARTFVDFPSPDLSQC